MNIFGVKIKHLKLYFHEMKLVEKIKINEK
jgi:hypothetical protein